MKPTAGVCVLAAVAMVGVLAGCGPSQDQINLAKALSARSDRQPTCNESARFLASRYMAAHDKDYVMWAMDYSSLCLMGGNFDQARRELLDCYQDIQHRQDKDKESKAAMSNESAKIFKGEPFERAMVTAYLGMLHYIAGDYNNARIFCARSDMEDATTEDDMADFRHDFRLAHYWLGKAYLKLGQEDNARIAFAKAGQCVPRAKEETELKRTRKEHLKMRTKRMRREAEAYKTACNSKPPLAGVCDASPSPALSEMPERLGRWRDVPGNSPVLDRAETLAEFLAPDFQAKANLIIIVESGTGPIKYLMGEGGYRDVIIRNAYLEREVAVYLDGFRAGQAYRMLDMFHQADTRGTSEKDRAQLTKGITKSVLKQLPYISWFASAWDVRADHRYWHLLPGNVHVFTAEVAPGRYTVNLQCADANGHLLPRYSVTRYYVPVEAGRENIYLIHTKPEADNEYFAATN